MKSNKKQWVWTFFYYYAIIFWTLFIFGSTTLSILAWSIYYVKGFLVGLFGMVFGACWLFFAAQFKPNKKRENFTKYALC